MSDLSLEEKVKMLAVQQMRLYSFVKTFIDSGVDLDSFISTIEANKNFSDSGKEDFEKMIKGEAIDGKRFIDKYMR